MENTRKHEKKNLNYLNNELYDYQRKLGNIQTGLEDLIAKNSVLDREFESEIDKKNENQKEVG